MFINEDILLFGLTRGCCSVAIRLEKATQDALASKIFQELPLQKGKKKKVKHYIFV